MPVLKSLADLLNKELKEVHSAERQLSRTLPKLAKDGSTPNLCSRAARSRAQTARGPEPARVRRGGLPASAHTRRSAQCGI